jgi:hypothetical protein
MLNHQFAFLNIIHLLFSPLLLCLLLWLLLQLSMHLPLSMHLHLSMLQPQHMVLSLPTPTLSHPTTTTMGLLIQKAKPTLELARPVKDTTPMENTMSTFLMVVSRLSPTLLMAMAILLMSNTLESLSTHQHQLMPQFQLMLQLQLLLLPQPLMLQHLLSTDLHLLLTDQLPTGPPSLAKQLIKNQRLFDFCDINNLYCYFYLLKNKLQKI